MLENTLESGETVVVAQDLCWGFIEGMRSQQTLESACRPSILAFARRGAGFEFRGMLNLPCLSREHLPDFEIAVGR